MKIAVIGSGNVATHLANAFYQAEDEIVQIFSPNEEHAKALAIGLFAPHTSRWESITEDADVYLVCLSDDSLTAIPKSFKRPGRMIIHTSGSVAMEVLNGVSERYGVAYPFQTFSIGREINIEQIPFFIEASNTEAYDALYALILKLSPKIYDADLKKRNLIQLSGVFASNFSNYMYYIAETLLKEGNVPFEVLSSLITETAAKALDLSPEDAQTGPSIRGDHQVIEKHLDYLRKAPRLAEIYELISEGIAKIPVHDRSERV